MDSTGFFLRPRGIILKREMLKCRNAKGQRGKDVEI